MINLINFNATTTSSTIPNLEIKLSPILGYGVFARKRFYSGDVIEISPFVVVSPSSAISFKNIAFNYDNDHWAIALGYGSIYNHSQHPNAKYEIDRDHNQLIFTALTTIEEEDEITIDYGKEWFTQRNLRMVEVGHHPSSSLRTIRALLLTAILIFLAIYIPPLNNDHLTPKSVSEPTRTSN